MKTKITELLQIEYPVFQGGMAWVAEHKLAAAVSNAGGLGIIGAASAPPEVVREEIRKCKELTDKPFGVNIMLLNPNAEDVAKIVVEEGVKAVTTGAGNPGKFMELWKNAGVKVIPVVASVAMAKKMERAGADAVVAEGMESGGHIGSTTTMALVPQVVDAVSIPVIAAGGIADGRGMAAAFMLGAEGIQMGTRFVASKESIVHENYKNQIIKAKDIDSVVTGMSTGHPVRSLRNQMTREYLKLEKENADFMELEKLTLGSLRKAVQDGETSAAACFVYGNDALALFNHSSGVNIASCGFCHGNGFACHGGLVHCHVSLGYNAVEWYHSAGANHYPVADLYFVYRNKLFAAVGFEPYLVNVERHSAGKVCNGLFARPVFKHLADSEHEHNAASRVEVSANYGNRNRSCVKNGY